MGQFDIGQLEFRTSLVQRLKFLDMQDIGPPTWAHMNGSKCTEIFIQQFLKVENQND